MPCASAPGPARNALRRRRAVRERACSVSVTTMRTTTSSKSLVAIMLWKALPQPLKHESSACARRSAQRCQRAAFAERVRAAARACSASSCTCGSGCSSLTRKRRTTSRKSLRWRDAVPRVSLAQRSRCAAPQARRRRSALRCIWRGSGSGSGGRCCAAMPRRSHALGRGFIHSVHQLALGVAVRHFQRLQRHRIHQRLALALAAADGAVEKLHCAAAAPAAPRCRRPKRPPGLRRRHRAAHAVRHAAGGCASLRRGEERAAHTRPSSFCVPTPEHSKHKCVKLHAGGAGHTRRRRAKDSSRPACSRE